MNLDYTLSSKDELTGLAKSNGIKSWNELTEFVRCLPYGRNENRVDVGLVLSEKKGTCSSKHVLLKSIADLNEIPNVKLIMGMYRMNQLNTPKIGTWLTDNSIEFIPEAHCYLKINNERIDLTTNESDFQKIEKDIIEEIEIEPGQVGEYKVHFHKAFVKRWLKETNSEFEFDKIWQIREKCIESLTGKN